MWPIYTDQDEGSHDEMGRMVGRKMLTNYQTFAGKPSTSFFSGSIQTFNVAVAECRRLSRILV